MNIFISWSKDKSKELAIETKTLLGKLDSSINAFVSEVDIRGGEDVQKKILERIAACDRLILCFTKENKRSPWLLYEAGYARGLNKIVIPLLFDDDPSWHSWVDNPMNVTREIRYNSSNFDEVLLDCLDMNETPANIMALIEYKQRITAIGSKYKVVDSQCEDLVDTILSNDAFMVENPTFKNKTAYFLTGFESYPLLKIILDSFVNTGKYLWIYGRKNMKLFGGSFKEFFDYIKEKAIAHPDMAGIDFRCLFLDPSSPEVEKAHVQSDLLKTELKATIQRAKYEIGENDRLKKCFRMYANKRDRIIIRLDNSIIYSRPSFDADGRPQLLTNSAFEVFGVNSEKGIDCIAIFDSVWNDAKDVMWDLPE